MIGKKLSALTLTALIVGVLAQFSVAYGDDEPTVEPYIDHLKKENPALTNPETNNTSPYIDSLKAKAKSDDSEGYTENIKKQLNGGNPSPSASSTPSYTDEEKAKIGPGDQGSSIADVKNGNSSLKYEKKGEIHNAFGIKFGVGLTRNLVADSSVGTGRNFNGVYGGNYAPDIALYYEYQFLRGYTGKIGLFAQAEVGIFKGLGTFQVQPHDATNSDPTALLSDQSNVQFTYIEIPGIVGLDYRLSIFKFVEPYVMGGPSIIGGMETRNDGGASHSVLSYGGYGAFGLSFLMDWISQSDDWARYDELNVKHTYLSIEFSDLKSIGGAVNYNIFGPYAGVTFEF